MEFAAIVLAGGTARRLGGVSKPLLDVGGQPMVLRVLEAVAEARPRIVVGPQELAPVVEHLDYTVLTREDPPLGGPVAAVAAGFAALPGPVSEVCLLAGDLPLVTESTIRQLADALDDDRAADVAVALDPGARRQFLLARWRVPALGVALRRVGPPAHRALRDLYADAAITEVTALDDAYLDCDTETDLDAARRLLTGRGAGQPPPGR